MARSLEGGERMWAALLAPLLGTDARASGPLDAATWQALAGQAERERMGPLLYAAVQGARRDDVPPEVLARLAALYQRAAAATLYQQQELAAILRACAAAQVPCIVLKGCALGVTLYPDPALRPCGDLDLLLHPEHIAWLVDYLDAGGYVCPYGGKPGKRLPRHGNEYHLSRYGRRPAIVEPHWHITSKSYYMRRIPVSWCWAGAVPVVIAGAPAMALAPEVQFLHLVSHYALHIQGRHLLWSFDLALLLARQGSRWNWEKIAEDAARFELSSFVKGALDLAARQWGVAAPAGAAALAHLRAGYGERVAGWVAQQGETPIWMVWQVTTAPPRAALRMSLPLLLPAPASVRGLLDPHQRAALVRSYLRRIARLPAALWALGRAMWRLR